MHPLVVAPSLVLENVGIVSPARTYDCSSVGSSPPSSPTSVRVHIRREGIPRRLSIMRLLKIDMSVRIVYGRIEMIAIRCGGRVKTTMIVTMDEARRRSVIMLPLEGEKKIIPRRIT